MPSLCTNITLIGLYPTVTVSAISHDDGTAGGQQVNRFTAGNGVDEAIRSEANGVCRQHAHMTRLRNDRMVEVDAAHNRRSSPRFEQHIATCASGLNTVAECQGAVEQNQTDVAFATRHLDDATTGQICGLDDVQATRGCLTCCCCIAGLQATNAGLQRVRSGAYTLGGHQCDVCGFAIQVVLTIKPIGLPDPTGAIGVVISRQGDGCVGKQRAQFDVVASGEHDATHARIGAGPVRHDDVGRGTIGDDAAHRGHVGALCDVGVARGQGDRARAGGGNGASRRGGQCSASGQ